MLLTEVVRQAREARHQARLTAATAVIPEGPYCYGATGISIGSDGLPRLAIAPCPYWKRRSDQPAQRTGYCRFLKVGDATPGRDANGRPRSTLMLWDQVKECGINEGDLDGDDAPTEITA